MTRDGILNTTAESFFHQLRDDTDFISLIAILASASEIANLLSTKKGNKKEKKERQSKVEELEKVVDAKKVELDITEDVMMKQEHRVEVKTAPARRARALLWSHLLRLDLEDAEFKSGELSADQASTIRCVLMSRTRIYLGFCTAPTHRSRQHLARAQLAEHLVVVHEPPTFPSSSCPSRCFTSRSTAQGHGSTGYRDGYHPEGRGKAMAKQMVQLRRQRW